ncbi:MAG TPA: hypothetical protein VGO67_25860 [Verrucomicrobiae bacterium]
MRNRVRRPARASSIFGILFLTVAISPVCKADLQSRDYDGGFKVVLKLGEDLSQSLPSKYAKQIDTDVIALETEELPVASPISTTQYNNIFRQVTLSAGFIDLINHICHAKAADRVQPGFFDEYIKTLVDNNGDGIVRAPAIVDSRFWTCEVINEQMSYFNQMVGFIMAINLSHHYLGHYDKYASKMMGPGIKLTPINDFLTPAEWEVSVRAAAVDSLDCALATDGTRVLFDAISKMPVRPAWADYVVPPGTDIKKLNRELARYEEDFFRGQLK